MYICFVELIWTILTPLLHIVKRFITKAPWTVDTKLLTPLLKAMTSVRDDPLSNLATMNTSVYNCKKTFWKKQLVIKLNSSVKGLFANDF